MCIYIYIYVVQLFSLIPTAPLVFIDLTELPDRKQSLRKEYSLASFFHKFYVKLEAVGNSRER